MKKFSKFINATIFVASTTVLYVFVFAVISWLLISIFGKSNGVGFGITLYYAHAFLAVLAFVVTFSSTILRLRYSLLFSFIGHLLVAWQLFPGSTDLKKYMVLVFLSFLTYAVFLINMTRLMKRD